MKKCNYCERSIKDEDEFCAFCGYDPKTDAVSPNFRRKTIPEGKLIEKVKVKEKKASIIFGIGPGIKKFAFIGLAIVVFSIFYKYSFNIKAVVSEVGYLFSRIKSGKFSIGAFGLKVDKNNEETVLIDMRTFEMPQDETREKDLVIEGIFSDSDSKSFVVINGKVISEGENLNNITVKKINRDSVEVIVDGQSKVLGLNQSIPLSTKK